MDLPEYIKTFPRSERMRVRNEIAAAHGVSEVTVRSWANGTRKHPCSLVSVQITEEATDHKVSRYDLRPDVFGSEL